MDDAKQEIAVNKYPGNNRGVLYTGILHAFVDFPYKHHV
jgi:hypothetical protein